MITTHTSGQGYKHKRRVTPSSNHICQHCWLVKKAVKTNARINRQLCDQIFYNTRTNKCYFKLTSKLTGKQKRKSGQMTHLYFCTSRCSSRLQLRETKGSAHNLSTRSEELETRQRIPVFHTNHEVRIRFQAFSKLCQAKITKQNQDFHSKTH